MTRTIEQQRHVESLAERVKRLPVDQKLLMALQLFEADRRDLAEAVTKLAYEDFVIARGGEREL